MHHKESLEFVSYASESSLNLNTHPQCCGAPTFLGSSGSGRPSRGPGSSKMGSAPRLQAKIGGSRRLRLQTLQFFILSSEK